MTRLADLTTLEVQGLLAQTLPAILLPVGSVEPHGPHLPLGTDSVISETACLRAVPRLLEHGVHAVVAPTVSYGVTDFSAGFAGALSIPASQVTEFLRAIVEACLRDGWKHVCLVNNHLEPAQDEAIRKAAAFESGKVSVACPLSKRWGRTLSDEFKRGNCHAGRYETSLALAAGLSVREHAQLPNISVSLSDEIRGGKTSFRAMGLDRAYTGAPSEASKEEGDALYEKLVAMIVGEVTDALGVST